MGCDIFVVAQRKTEKGWQDIEDLSVFDWRSYAMFGFFADVRNYSAVPSISKCRGLPEGFFDSRGFLYHTHSQSWLALSELEAFNYDREFEDRRYTNLSGPPVRGNSQTCEPGAGKMTTFREFLGEEFFESLSKAKNAGADRIVFGFVL